MSSEVETSLDVSVLTRVVTTEMVRDSSTSVGMTELDLFRKCRPQFGDDDKGEANRDQKE